MFGAKKEDITGEWRKLHNVELQALYSSPNIIMNLKSGRLRWVGHVTHIGKIQKSIQSFSGKISGRKTFREAKT